MSPEDKLKRASIFKKMALRDKLEASRKRQSLRVLREELSKNQDIRNQLENLVKEATYPDDAQTAMALYSASWYNVRVRDQLEMVANRCTHLIKKSRLCRLIWLAQNRSGPKNKKGLRNWLARPKRLRRIRLMKG